MWNVLESLTDRVVLLVLGTSGKVLPISEIAMHYPGFKILNNLGPESAIDDTQFDKVLHMPATQGVKLIDSLLADLL